MKVAGATNPVARGVIDAQQKYGKFATRLYGMVGGRSIEEAVLYSLPIMAPNEALSAG